MCVHPAIVFHLLDNIAVITSLDRPLGPRTRRGQVIPVDECVLQASFGPCEGQRVRGAKLFVVVERSAGAADTRRVVGFLTRRIGGRGIKVVLGVRAPVKDDRACEMVDGA